MCEYCYGIGGRHQPGCPNEEPPKVLGICERCQCEITEGMEVLWTPYGVLCEDCEDEMTFEDLADFFGCERQKAEEAFGDGTDF